MYQTTIQLQTSHICARNKTAESIKEVVLKRKHSALYEITRIKKMKNLILLILALIAEASAFLDASNCTEEFHMILNKAVEIKNHCNIRGFYDCCQVRINNNTLSFQGFALCTHG